MEQLIIAEASAAKPEGEQLFSVRLIDCRTGEVPRLNGMPFSVLTRAPRATASFFMRGRSRSLWRTEIEPVGAN